jgi:pimeloyl-ACP methyl ester carboxylesterase
MARVREFDTDQAVRQAMDLFWERGYEASTLQDLPPDLPGSGGSDAPEGGYDKATLANDVHQLILALGLDGEVSIVGHDIGAIVAYAYAAAHPGRRGVWRSWRHRRSTRSFTSSLR